MSGSSINYDTLIELNGSPEALGEFSQRHLSGQRFSFNSLKPVPEELKMTMNNFVEDGYDALYGDWTKLTGRRMFKEIADERGYPFPLETHEQVLECINCLGEFGEQRLALGRQLKSNLDRYGYGIELDWCKAHWGMKYDVDFPLAEVLPDRTRLTFMSLGPIPKKALALLSSAHPELTFTVSSINESGLRAKKFDLKNGRQAATYTVTDGDVSNAIWQYQGDLGLRLLASVSDSAEWLDQIESSKRGHSMLKGTRFSVDVLMHYVSEGEAVESLAERFSALNERHILVLRSLAAVGGRPSILIPPAW